MRKIVFGISLFIALVAAGCTGAHQRLHQSMLLHENRQLEDALYVAQAQVADLQRENDVLRKQQNGESRTPSRRSSNDSWLDDWNIEPIEMPKVILPPDTGTTEVPESIKGVQMMYNWTPGR